MIGFHPPVRPFRKDPPFCPVGRNQWSGGRARHRPCLPKPLQLTNEAFVSFYRRNGIVAAKMKDETRSDHKTIVLLQTQWPSGRELRGRIMYAIPEIAFRRYLW